MRVPVLFNKKTQTLRRKLFGYMLMLVVSFVILVFIIGLFFVDNFTTTKERLFDVLSLQTEVFEREITAHHDNLAMRCIQLSTNTTKTLEDYFIQENIQFDDLQDSSVHIDNIQNHIMDQLIEQILKTECSGGFVLLDTTVNSKTENAEHSKTGVYLQRSSVDANDDSMLLFRGNSNLAKSKNIMQHEKWQLEFNSKFFPNFDDIIKTSDIPLEKAYRITDIKTLSGTTERVMLLAAPILGDNGTIYGICGFEISSTTFKIYHAQPSTLEHLVCTFSKKNKNTIDIENSFSSGIINGYYFPPKESLNIQKFGKGLELISNADEEYVGITRNVHISYGENNDFLISVMIPKQDYNQMHRKNIVRLIIFILLLLFFAVSCCGFFSKRFISPIIRSLEEIKQFTYTDASSEFTEIDDLFTFLSLKDKEVEKSISSLIREKDKAENEASRAKSEVNRLSYSRKNEIDPADYENFVIGIKTLTKTERVIFDMYLSDMTGKEITDALGIKESTLKYHNHNLYQKLGVTSRKQMLRYAALLSNDNNEQE